ncbi:hypothetical protein RchiOBHm_Chr7g0228251 [Rosa chinensis]|uniref:Uncharacterized protein n=1 Tax=Rosa chinensis TaxID=74649 RepID=A0A2P6PEU1_ROSCH|nr:hypothetical protein RchiOBHm_Chr7g0228251 [Rosa chinensis]
MGLGSCLCNLYLNNQQVAGKCFSERFGGHPLTQTLPTSPSQDISPNDMYLLQSLH